MRRVMLLVCLLLLPLVGGCAHNYYNLPQDVVANKVKMLGMVPIIVDTDSDIRFPQKDELVALLTTMNRTYERDLLRLVKKTNSFYTVTLLDVDPKAVFTNLLFRRERRDDASIQYNKYFWKQDALADFMHKNSLDAVMFVVINGITRSDKISSSNLLESLETDYDFLVMTAQIVDAQGTVLWEYPNFRQRSLSYSPIINLQYPDFDEASANQSPKVQLKFKTLEGIRRALEKRKKDLLMRETNEVELYMDQFESMTAMLEIDKERKPAPVVEPAAKKGAKESKK